MKRIAILTLAFLAIPLMAAKGCASWDQTAYETLAASNATITQAQTDYATNAPGIAHTPSAWNIINAATKTQKAAADALVAYEEAKAAGGTTANLAALQADVTVALANIPTVIADVKALYTNGGK